MNLPSQHLESLADFGYNEREAQFLYIAATFSGYFTQRQFLTFIQSRRGKRSHLFAQKVLNNGHATVRDYMGWGPISHLFCRTLYKAIGIDPSITFPNGAGRPMYILEDREPVKELIGG